MTTLIETISNLLSKSEGAGLLLLAFVGGFVSSLTPCVYPLIPVTIAVFGAGPSCSRGRAFILSSTYVLGIAFTYTALGVVSAWTGFVFGSLLSQPLVIAIGFLFLLALSFYTLDLFAVPLLSPLQQRASQVGEHGLGGAFLMGTVSGVVAAPCVGPVLVTVLGLAASSQRPLWGAMLLFSYSLGIGVIFVVLGTFSALLRRLPRSGPWLNGVKFAIAVAVLIAALFLLHSLFPIPPFPSSSSLLKPLLLTALVAVTLTAAFVSYMRSCHYLRILSAGALALAAYQLLVPQLPPAAAPAGSHSEWQSGLPGAVSEARKHGRKIMVDLYADWCAACKELEVETFQDPDVQHALSSFVKLRIDFTRPGRESAEVAARYQVPGLPCILFLFPDGREIPGTRVTGFLPPDRFRLRIEEAAAAH